MSSEPLVPRGPQVDIARLPDDVVALIDALRPGEELVITRDGVPIATISTTGGALEGEIVTPDKPNEVTEQPRAEFDAVTVVATAMKLSERARASLSADLGTDYIVVDMNSAPTTSDVLLVPPISPQLIANLRFAFPTARIVVTEIEDDDLGISYRGPIGRILDAGAETYLPSTSISNLARTLDRVVAQRPQIVDGRSAQHAIEPPATLGTVDLTVFPALPAGRGARRGKCRDDRDTGRCDPT
jgi:antitoxin (DNA-binding transcriptional repressor) of toxin-antitoxin stability system